MGTANLTLYPYDGSVASLSAGSLLDSNLINTGGSGRAGWVTDVDGILSLSDNLISTLTVPDDGVADAPLTYLGSGTFSTISLLGITLDTRPVTALEANGQVYLIAPSGFPLLSGLSVSFDIDPNTPYTLTTFVPCFVAGTLIDTPSGPRPVETLRRGDRVRDVFGNDLPIVWSGGREAEAKGARHAQDCAATPVLIPKDHFGPSAPSRPTLVSQQHRIVVKPRSMGRKRMLTRAKLLLDHGLGLSPRSGPVRYCHILLDRHAVLNANGMEAESLRLGRMTASAVGPEAWQDIKRRLPAAALPGYEQKLCLPDLGRSALRRVMRSERAVFQSTDQPG